MAFDHYAPQLTLREARARYFEANGFGDDGGYNKKFDVFKFGPIPVAIPNISARVAALKYHDLHHVVTGYKTDWRGEFEIACYEIAAGCGTLWFAWAINLSGVGGAFLLPKRAVKAWARGRRSGGLYRKPCDDALLSRTVGNVRHELLLEEHPEPTLGDKITFALTGIIGAIFGLLTFAAPVTVVVALVWWLLAT